MVGHTADEFFDADTATLLHEHDAKVLASGRARSSAGDPLLQEERRPASLYLTIKTPIVGPQGEIVGLSGSPSTSPSEHFEQALKNQQFLDAILDSVDGYIYTKGQDHRYTYTNRAAAAVSAHAGGSRGMQDSELLPPSRPACGHPTTVGV